MAITPRIGVLTFHRCINYGSYWQARCLVDGLRAWGHDAVLLDHGSARVNRAEWRCALDPMPWKQSSRADRDAYRAKARAFFAAFADLPLSRPFPLEEPQAAEPMDLVLVGSDEVWNLRHPWFGGEPIFYGEQLPAKRLASYAASFGNHPATDQLEPAWAERLERFNAISVRDANSQALISDALGAEPVLVLDPCLQFSNAIVSPANLADEGYIAVYGHDFPPWFSAQIARRARAQGLEMVSIGYRNSWADRQWIDAGPLDFAAFMAGASAVVTNFFHGCVFALVNNKPFVTAPSEYRSNKVRDLMGALGAGAHLVTAQTPAAHYDAMLGAAPEDAIYRTMRRLRQQSDAFLHAVLP